MCTWEVEGCKSSFYYIWDNTSFSVEFQVLSDAGGCKSKYCPSAAGPRSKQQQITYWSKENDVLSQIQN